MRKTFLKTIAAACLMILLSVMLSGCGTTSVFDGSRTADENSFRLDYATLNREQSADLKLAEGDELRVEFAHTRGNVDIVIGIEGKTPVYRGTNQQNGKMALSIMEAGTYHISVTGHNAAGKLEIEKMKNEE